MAAVFRNVPVHFWLVAVYVVVWGAAFATTETADEMQRFFTDPVFPLPVMGGGSVDVSWTLIFVFVGFISTWLEAIRATQVRGSTLNDVLSLLLAFAALGLFIGVSMFQTPAFLVVVIVSFGDVLLDRIIGQAVAQRDFGGMFPVGGDGGQ